MLISRKQHQANRENAQHSTGPVSPEGKAAVRLNALTFGLRARDVVLIHEDASRLPATLGCPRIRVAAPSPHRKNPAGTYGRRPLAAHAHGSH